MQTFNKLCNKYCQGVLVLAQVVLLEEGLAEAEVDDLIARGVFGQAEPKAKL